MERRQACAAGRERLGPAHRCVQTRQGAGESTLLQFGEASGTSAGLRAVAMLSSELVKQRGVWRFERCSIDAVAAVAWGREA